MIATESPPGSRKAHPPECANQGGEEYDLTNYSPESRAILAAHTTDFSVQEFPFVEQTDVRPEPVVTDKPKRDIPRLINGNDSDQGVTGDSNAKITPLISRNVTDSSRPLERDSITRNSKGCEQIFRVIFTDRWDEIGVHVSHNDPRCDLCRRTLEPGEPVFRCKVRNRYGWFNPAVACEACARAALRGEPLEHYRPVLCRYCGRRIFSRYGQAPTRHYCSKDCRNAAALQRGKHYRAIVRGIRCCPECGQDFWPKRTDSLYCSAKCKQKAYRKREKESEAQRLGDSATAKEVAK